MKFLIATDKFQFISDDPTRFYLTDEHDPTDAIRFDSHQVAMEYCAETGTFLVGPKHKLQIIEEIDTSEGPAHRIVD